MPSKNTPLMQKENIKSPALEKILERVSQDDFEVVTHPTYHCDSMYAPLTDLGEAE